MSPAAFARILRHAEHAASYLRAAKACDRLYRLAEKSLFPVVEYVRVTQAFLRILPKYGSYELSERCPLLVLELGK